MDCFHRKAVILTLKNTTAFELLGVTPKLLHVIVFTMKDIYFKIDLRLSLSCQDLPWVLHVEVLSKDQ